MIGPGPDNDKKYTSGNGLCPIETDYFLCPNSIFDLPLNIYKKLALAYFYRCGNNGTQIFPSYAKIAKSLSISRRHAMNVVDELIKEDWLHKELRYEKSNLYSVNQKKIEKYSAGEHRSLVSVIHRTSDYSSPPGEQGSPLQSTITTNTSQLTSTPKGEGEPPSTPGVNNNSLREEGITLPLSGGEGGSREVRKGPEKVSGTGSPGGATKKTAGRQPPDPRIKQIFSEIKSYFKYPSETNIDPIPNYGKEGKAIKRMLDRGFSPDDVYALWEQKTKLRNGYCSMTFVNEDLDKWINDGRKSLTQRNQPPANGGNHGRIYGQMAAGIESRSRQKGEAGSTGVRIIE